MLKHKRMNPLHNMLHLYNTLTRKKEIFQPLTPGAISMYVCGPTVYAPPHIGNARSVVVYDTLYRGLCHFYDEAQVTYVRNITDVDDKINAAAKERGVPISHVTAEAEAIFQEAMAALHCLPPTHQPHATNHIHDMVMIIQRLIERGHAYESAGHVYFSVESDPHYGTLSGRKLDAMVAGARVEISEHKRHPGDFVLWKPADADDDPSALFDSPWGKGRPGWHIECSAMSMHFLGENFDIHGGGADLMFPHHTNEIAQSTCAFPGSHFARYWVHNGFVTVEGEKMSKSLGNFITVQDLLTKGYAGAQIRWVFLSTHYRKPLDFNLKSLQDAQSSLEKFGAILPHAAPGGEVPTPVLEAWQDDLNIPLAMSHLHGLAQSYHGCASVTEKTAIASSLRAACDFLGIYPPTPKATQTVDPEITHAYMEARARKDFATADKIRDDLFSKTGLRLVVLPDGTCQAQ